MNRAAENTRGAPLSLCRKRFRKTDKTQPIHVDSPGEPRTEMNLNGRMMNHGRMRLSSTSGDMELTRMEITCLKLAANGLRPAEIGSELNTTDKEIEIHLTSAESKLGARNRLHAIGVAVSQGLIGIDGK